MSINVQNGKGLEYLYGKCLQDNHQISARDIPPTYHGCANALLNNLSGDQRSSLIAEVATSCRSITHGDQWSHFRFAKDSEGSSGTRGDIVLHGTNLVKSVSLKFNSREVGSRRYSATTGLRSRQQKDDFASTQERVVPLLGKVGPRYTEIFQMSRYQGEERYRIKQMSREFATHFGKVLQDNYRTDPRNVVDVVRGMMTGNDEDLTQITFRKLSDRFEVTHRSNFGLINDIDPDSFTINQNDDDPNIVSSTLRFNCSTMTGSNIEMSLRVKLGGSALYTKRGAFKGFKTAITYRELQA